MAQMKLDSLKNKAEFDFIYKNAQRFFHKNFVLYALQLSAIEPLGFRAQRVAQSIKSRHADMYIGLSISRKIGKACVRNLLKRRIRAILYENHARLRDYIFVFVARGDVAMVDFMTLQRDLLFAVTKICQAPQKPYRSFPKKHPKQVRA